MDTLAERVARIWETDYGRKAKLPRLDKLTKFMDWGRKLETDDSRPRQTTITFTDGSQLGIHWTAAGSRWFTLTAVEVADEPRKQAEWQAKQTERLLTHRPRGTNTPAPPTPFLSVEEL